MRFHSQNLNELPGDKYGPMWREGRCWFYFTDRTKLNVEWSILKGWRTAAGIDLGEHDHAFMLHLSIVKLFSLYISFDNPWLNRIVEKFTTRKNQGYGNGRSIGISLWPEGSIHVELWSDPTAYKSSDPKWWKFTIDFPKLLFGRQNCTTETLEERDVLVPMPEKAYPAKAKLVLYTWKRPRWFPKSFTRVEIDVPGGIPKEGKGENSWDCGRDATYGITTGSCKTIAEGVGVLVGSVLHDRVRHGGWDDWNWQKS